MPLELSETLAYRGMSIAIKVDGDSDSVYGRADVHAGDDFKGRLACGSAQRRPEEVLERVRCLAKAKVNAWSVAPSALEAAGNAPF